METSVTLFQLFALTSYLFGGCWLVGTALYWLDQWLDTDIAEENANHDR